MQYFSISLPVWTEETKKNGKINKIKYVILEDQKSLIWVSG